VASGGVLKYGTKYNTNKEWIELVTRSFQADTYPEAEIGDSLSYAFSSLGKLDAY
jgi:hypothetical protein